MRYPVPNPVMVNKILFAFLEIAALEASFEFLKRAACLWLHYGLIPKCVGSHKVGMGWSLVLDVRKCCSGGCLCCQCAAWEIQ